MNGIFIELAKRSLTAGWLVIAVLLFRILLKRTPRKVFPFLWGLVGLRLLLPFSLKSRLSLVPSEETVTEGLETAAREFAFSEDFFLPAEPETGKSLWEAVWKILTENIGVIWLVGCLLMLLYMVVSSLLLRRKLAESVPYEKGVRQSALIGGAFILGFFRPTIYLPFSVPEANLPFILAHERVHIRRGDHRIKPLGFLLLSVYWFNPLLWAAYICLCRDIEFACDEQVIGTLNREERAAYSLALLSAGQKERKITVCPVAFGSSAVGKRIKHILLYRKPTFWVIAVTVLVCTVTAVCFLTEKKDTAPALSHPTEEASVPEEEPTEQEKKEEKLLRSCEEIRQLLEKKELDSSTAEGIRRALYNEYNSLFIQVTNLSRSLSEAEKDDMDILNTISGERQALLSAWETTKQACLSVLSRNNITESEYEEINAAFDRYDNRIFTVTDSMQATISLRQLLYEYDSGEVSVTKPAALSATAGMLMKNAENGFLCYAKYLWKLMAGQSNVRNQTPLSLLIILDEELSDRMLSALITDEGNAGSWGRAMEKFINRSPEENWNSFTDTLLRAVEEADIPEAEKSYLKSIIEKNDRSMKGMFGSLYAQNGETTAA